LKDKASRKVSQSVASVADVAQEEEDKDKTKNQDLKTTTAPTVRTLDDLFSRNFEEFKKAYPNRSGQQRWSTARKAINARFREGDGIGWIDILAGTARYALYCEATSRTGTEYVMQAATFCGPDRGFLEPWDIPATKSESQQNQNISAAKQFLEESNGS